MRYVIAIALVLVSSSVLARTRHKVVDVPASRIAQMTPDEKKAALAYAKANHIRWREIKGR